MAFMAVQLHANAEFNLGEAATKELMVTTGISKALQQHYPKIAQLVKYNAVGAVKLLIATGCIAGSIKKSKFDIDRNYHDSSVVAWSKYRNAVLVWLEQQNNSADLEPARLFLRDEICDEWVQKAPCWPQPGEFGKIFTKDLNYNGKLENNNYIYLWSVLGTIKMQDYTAPSYAKFNAFIWGDPAVVLKCVRMDRHKLKMVNEAGKQDFAVLKRMADESTNRSMKCLVKQFAQIKWED